MKLVQKIGQATTSLAQPPSAPQWNTTEGDKPEFDVTSIRPNKSDGKPTTNVDLTERATYSPTGGVFSATNQSLLAYILFAYKVWASECPKLVDALPQWVYTDKYDIEAKTDNRNPTKDQMRLMMQSLLEDRFKLAAHRETRQAPIFALVLARPGRLGPQLKHHLADLLCSSASTSTHKPSPLSDPISTLLGVWPEQCESGTDLWFTNRIRMGGRIESMAEIAKRANR
jgi:uncharacterized protein (TIGR03435 family)